MDLMALFLELVATLIIVVMKPFWLIKLSCIFGVKSIFIVINTWIELLRAAICLHVNIVWRLVVWTVAFISLPGRVLTALHRERMMEMHLHEMQDELETILWDKKQLKERLKMVIKERRMMEVMLAELEEEHDQAIVKIEILEGELQDLKDESNRLKEVKGKAFWSSRDQADTVSGQNAKNADKYASTHEISPWRSSYNGSSVTLEDLLLHKDAWEDESKVKPEMHQFMKDGSKSTCAVIKLTPAIISKDSNVDDILDQRRDVALSQSLFSAILSLLVGIIIWEAEDPCMPLVVALFSVVGMSLKSVVQFFSTIKNKPASDAVALLSFNWFILGTLSYPTLPKAARMFAPLLFSLSDQTVRSLGISS